MTHIAGKKVIDESFYFSWRAASPEISHLKRASRIYHLLTIVCSSAINRSAGPADGYLAALSVPLEEKNKAPKLTVVRKGIRPCQSHAPSAS